MRLTPGCSLARLYQTKVEMIEVANAPAYYYMATKTLIKNFIL